MGVHDSGAAAAAFPVYEYYSCPRCGESYTGTHACSLAPDFAMLRHREDEILTELRKLRELLERMVNHA